jgi:IclR family transcriptional regulator, pca regulon regulatory protein
LSELGYVVVDQKLELGLRSIAVPLIGRQGRVEAALNVGAAVVSEVPGRMAEIYLNPLGKAARDISALLS